MKKVALVTGGSRGIGAAICKALAEEGYAVLVNYRKNRAAAQDIRTAIQKSGGEAKLIQADIGKAADRAQLAQTAFSWKGYLNLLVNNAGIAPAKRNDILEISEQEYKQVLRVNLTGTFFLTQKIATMMLKQAGPGSSSAIITISSVSAEFASTNRAAYCIAKAGLGMMTQLFADRLARHDIRVYEIRPGIIATDMTAGVQKKYDRMIAGGLTPIQRWGRPGDVAQAVMAIARDNFPFSTGEVFYVDGGLHIQRF